VYDCTFYISGQGISGRPSTNDVGVFLVRSAEAFGGEVASTGKFTGNGTPNTFRVNVNNPRVVIGGRATGGNYQFDFDSFEEAENFLAYARILRDFEGGRLFLRFCGNGGQASFAVSLDTNGGANNFVISKRDFDGVRFQVGGQSVSGQFRTVSIIAYVQEAARLYDCDAIRSGSFAGTQEPNIRRAQDNGRVVLGGRGVGGQFRWQCDNAAEAQNFADFLDLLAEWDLYTVDVTALED
jgi:hypothetical protein